MHWAPLDVILQRVGLAIRNAREGAKMTQFDLAERAGMTRQHLQRIEAGSTNPTVGTLYRLSKELGLDRIVLQWLNEKRQRKARGNTTNSQSGASRTQSSR
jgi:transcriptional regulator with XRE-family HTH domain